MGQDISKEDSARFRVAVAKLSKMELKDIESVFMELSTQSGDSDSVIKQPTWLNRDKFAEMFGVNELLVEQLFETFDQDKNGIIDMQEFVTGMALCLHGSLKDKCKLLFRVFNLDGDEGVDRDELTTLLTSCLQSARSVLLTTLKSQGLPGYEDQVASQTGDAIMVNVVVDRIVKDAFDKCDASGNGKLEIDEFIHWVHKNPKLVNNIFVTQCPKPSSDGSNPFDVIKSPTNYTNQAFFEEGQQQEHVEEELESSPDDIKEGEPNTLLKMSTQEKPSLQSLFTGPPQQPGAGGEFFDSLGKTTGELSHSHSDSHLDKYFDEQKKSAFSSHLASAAGDSMQSIKLSQDSLCEETVGCTVQLASDDVIPPAAEDVLEQTESKKFAQCEKSAEAQKQGYHAWIPNNQTRALLADISNARQVDPTNLTYPSVLVEGVMTDPVNEMVAKYLGDEALSKRPTLTVDQVELNESGLKKLLAANCWRAAVNWTTKYLTEQGQGLHAVKDKQAVQFSPLLLQIWYIRIALLMKLRMFSSAEAELNAFNDFDSPDLYYEYYPNLYPGLKGSMVPFSLRLVRAEISQHNGRPNIALDRLYALLHRAQHVVDNLTNNRTEDGSDEGLKEQDKESRLRIWKERILKIHYSIANCFLVMKEYTLSIRIFTKIISIEDPAKTPVILSAIARICLQLGDLNSAMEYLNKVENIGADDSILSNMILVNSGYMTLAQGNYEESYKHFAEASNLDPNNLAAGNNAAVCLLFMGKVKEACNLLETLVSNRPSSSLHPEILLNLNTVYELETCHSFQKKCKILDLVAKHSGDSLVSQCLKLT